MTLLSKRAPLSFSRIVVIGGGCYGSWYTGQIARAFKAGVLQVGEVVVVDRHVDCRVAAEHAQNAYDPLPIRIAVSSWAEYLDEWLASDASRLEGQALVPSPLMPHLLLDWLIARAKVRWPDRSVSVEPLSKAPRIPWERAAPDGRHYVSFAEWLCPINCIEPVLCPATKGPRSWSMPPAIAAYVAAQSAERPLAGPIVFHCTHRTHGVGMIDAPAIAIADQQIAEWGNLNAVEVLVGTVSHCHGALGVLSAR
ncbi:MAG: hypothetical protein ABJB66_06325 [Gemmatimonadaceae bacterium]